MNDASQDNQDPMRQLADEIRKLRKALWLGFAMITLIGGLVLVSLRSARFDLAAWACFAASLAGAIGAIGAAASSSLSRFLRALLDEARNQRS